MSGEAPEPTKFGRYTVKGILGEGAMGTVYLGEDPLIGREVAIKVIRAHAGLRGAEFEARQARFEREFRSAGLLAHLVLANNPPHHPQGDFALSDGLVSNRGQPRYTFSGIGLYRPDLFRDCRGGAFPLAPLLRDAVDRNLVSGMHHRGTWFDIGTPERLRKLDRLLAAGEPGADPRNGDVQSCSV